MKENIKQNLATAIGFVGIIGAIFFIIWAISPDSNPKSDKIAQELAENMSTYEKLEASVPQKTEVGNDLASQILAEKDAKPVKQHLVAEKAPSNEANKFLECTPQDKELRRNGCQPDPLATPEFTNRRVGSELKEISNPSKHPLLVWKEINEDRMQIFQGRKSEYLDRVVRAGCRVLGVIEDELIVTPDHSHDLTVNVRGALEGCALPKVDGIRLVGTAKMDRQGRYILSEIHTCSDRSPKRKSVPCKNVRIKSITGADLLEGWIYDESGWGLLWESVIAIGMTPSIARLAETAASAKTIYTSESASSIAATLNKALDRISQKISAAFDGREIRVKRNTSVIILFKDDVVL